MLPYFCEDYYTQKEVKEVPFTLSHRAFCAFCAFHSHDILVIFTRSLQLFTISLSCACCAFSSCFLLCFLHFITLFLFFLLFNFAKCTYFHFSCFFSLSHPVSCLSLVFCDFCTPIIFSCAFYTFNPVSCALYTLSSCFLFETQF